MPCDTLLLSVGLLPENEVAKTACVALDEVTGGPRVSNSLQTSVEGIYACGNALHIHDLVDHASDEGQAAGLAAARFVKKCAGQDLAQSDAGQNARAEQGGAGQNARAEQGGAEQKANLIARTIPVQAGSGVRYVVPQCIEVLTQKGEHSSSVEVSQGSKAVSSDSASELSQTSNKLSQASSKASTPIAFSFRVTKQVHMPRFVLEGIDACGNAEELRRAKAMVAVPAEMVLFDALGIDFSSYESLRMRVEEAVSSATSKEDKAQGLGGAQTSDDAQSKQKA